MNNQTNIIEAEHIKFRYESEQTENPESQSQAKLILDDVSIKIKNGEFVAVLGHNGSGKSTLAKHFNAICIPDEGCVIVDGMDTSDENAVFPIRKTVGMVFQNPDNQIVATVVEDDVAFAMENLGVQPKVMRETVDRVLEEVGMSEYKHHAPHQLSGGQKQRVAIAGILAMQPKCIVLDEPTAMLDPKGRREVMKTIKRLNREDNTTVVLITHYMDEAVQADRVVVVDHGRIIIDGTPREVFKKVEMLKSVGLDVPQVTDLAYRLRQHNIDVSNDILTVDECVQQLEKLLKLEKR